MGRRMEWTLVGIAVSLSSTPVFAAGGSDCNGNGRADECDIACGVAGGFCDVSGCGNSFDCNGNGIPDDCELVAGSSLDFFSSGFAIPEDILQTKEPYAPGFVVPDAGHGQVFLVAQSGTDVQVLASGLAAPIGATFAPDEFGGVGNRLFVALRDSLSSVVHIDPDGAIETFVSLPTTAPSGIIYIPLGFGGPAAGTLLVVDQTDTSGEPLGSVHSVRPDGSLITLFPTFGAALFTPAFAPSSFGVHGNKVFVGDALSSRLYTIDLQSLNIDLFAEIPLRSGQTGLRQMAFSPEGWAASIEPDLGEGSVLLLSVAASNDGYGGVQGTILVLDADANVIASLTSHSANRPLDTRGLAFVGNELLIANAAEGNLLRATIEDFAVHDCNGNAVPDSCDLRAGTSSDCNGNRIPDECDIADGIEPDCNGNGAIDACDIVNKASTDCTGNGIPDECEPDCDENGLADTCDLADGTHVDETGNGIPDICDPPAILFVSASAVGANTGLNWADAFPNLQDALGWAAASQVVDEIWVAEGTYKPDNPGGDRGASFWLVAGTAIFGGFTGMETSRGLRDPALHVTVLSGDLDGDDFAADGITNNSYHVVTGVNTDASAALDGFTIVGGNADGTSAADPFSGQGGGFLVRDGDVTIRNCRFEGNRALYGGALSGYNAFPTIKSCEFRENEDTAILMSSGSLGLENCLFVENRGLAGGALEVWSGSAYVRNCAFHRNAATNDYSGGGGGGALRSLGSALTVQNCVFDGNLSANEGGAVESVGGSISFTGCVFVGNEAAFQGGGLFTSSNTLIVDGCILFDNRDQGGFDESAQVDGTNDSARVVNYSCVQGLTGSLGGSGNIATNPEFVNAAGLDAQIGTQDDDLRLAPDSPCIDAGPPSVEWIPGEADLAGHPRVLCGRVDMGAFEFGIGDHNCDGALERSDWAGWSGCAAGPGSSFSEPGCAAFDDDSNGEVDLRDLAAFQRRLNGP